MRLRERRLTEDPLARVTATLKVLAHPARLRLLAMLRPGGLCVCQAAATLGAPVSTVSEHLAELRRAALVEEQREGRFVSYTLASDPEARAVLAHVWALIGEEAWVREDARLVRRVRRLAREELCDAGLDLRKLGIEPPRPTKEER